MTAQPVSATELLRDAALVLGAPLAPDAVARFVPVGGGVALETWRAALRSARAHGRLRLSERGVWTVTSVGAHDPAIRRLLLSPWSDDDAEATLLTIVAAVPGIALSRALALAATLDPDAAGQGGFARASEVLEDAGVIGVTGELRDPRLRVRDGILELLVPQTLSMLRSRRHAEAYVEVLRDQEPGSLGSGERLALARSALELGEALPAGLLKAAAADSLRTADARLSYRISEAAVRAGGGFDAELALAAAEVQVGETAAAVDRLSRIASQAEDDLQRGDALVQLHWQARDRVIDAGLATGDAVELVDPGVDEAAYLRARARRGFVVAAIGDEVGAVDLIRSAVGVLDGAELAIAKHLLGFAAMMRGQLSSARTLLDEGIESVRASGGDDSRILNTYAYLDQWDGRLSQAITFARDAVDATELSEHREAKAICAWSLGGALLTSGRLAEAEAALARAVTIMDDVGVTRTVQMVRTDLATTLAQRGDVDAARSALRPALAARHEVPDLDAKVTEAEAWIAASDGRADDAVELLRAASARFSEKKASLAALSMLVDAARLGGAGVVLPEIEQFANEVEGEHFVVMVRNARAMAGAAARVPGDVARLAAEFGEIGDAATALELHLVAAEAHAHASSAYRAAGDARRAAASIRNRDASLAVCGIDSIMYLPQHDAPAAGRLSERETQIASLAASGRSNREIAAELVVSIRTVETHLQRVYAKLGIRGRGELPRVSEADVTDAEGGEPRTPPMLPR